jgi:MscS family membrane protein
MQTVLPNTDRPTDVRLGLLLFCLCLFLAGSPPASASDPHPLAPPDRSSPRATLLSFMAHMDTAHRAYLGNGIGSDVAAAFRRAIDCLDLREVAPTLHFDMGGYSALLLKEILDRLDLPPADAIPGENTDIDRWTIPQTEIAVIRVEEGELAVNICSANAPWSASRDTTTT